MPGPKRKERICKICKKAFIPSDDARASRICDQHRRGPITLENAKKDLTRKAILLREHGRKCWICKNTTWMGQPIPIQLDHIDGNPDNNARENLRLLCPNCHAQTDTFTGKNKGQRSTRNSYRLKYYKPSERKKTQVVSVPGAQ